jgi:protein-L-isoaspartate(D-aspartate) O-methyltransferase
LPQFAPFDKILLTAGTKAVPQALLEQLKPGGILVAPVGSTNSQMMKKIVKNKDGSFTETQHGSFRFVPLLSNTAND